LTSFNIPDGEIGRGMALSQIVIEAEGLGHAGTAMCLRVDTHLIATNLTTAQMKFLICELLDRIEGTKQLRTIEPRLH
jgi:hypothetical protein